MVSTLFTDIPTPLANFMLQPFGAVDGEFSGMNGKMTLGGEPLALAKEPARRRGRSRCFSMASNMPGPRAATRICTPHGGLHEVPYAQAVLVVRKDG